jgi:hypothetical protein
MKGAITMGEVKVRTEESKVSADESVAKVKELIAEGNVRRVIIQTDEGRTLQSKQGKSMVSEGER